MWDPPLQSLPTWGFGSQVFHWCRMELTWWLGEEYSRMTPSALLLSTFCSSNLFFVHFLIHWYPYWGWASHLRKHCTQWFVWDFEDEAKIPNKSIRINTKITKLQKKEQHLPAETWAESIPSTWRQHVAALSFHETDITLPPFCMWTLRNLRIRHTLFVT